MLTYLSIKVSYSLWTIGLTFPYRLLITLIIADVMWITYNSMHKLVTVIKSSGTSIPKNYDHNTSKFYFEVFCSSYIQ